jgi:hypothetical protein
MTDTETGSLPKETGIRNTLKRYLGPDGVIMILLVLLAIVGIGITDFSPLLSHWYWLAVVVVTGITCIVTHTMHWKLISMREPWRFITRSIIRPMPTN